MPTLESKVNPRDPTFARNRDAMAALVADMREKIATIEQGGGDASRARHVARGKLLPRERVRTLLDPGTPFLELSQFAAYGMYDDNIAGAGIITGIGRVRGPRMRDRLQRRDGQGRHVLPDDGEEARARAGDRARRTVCRASISSIPAAPTCRLQDEVFPDREHFGRIFYNQATHVGAPAFRRSPW